MAKKSPAAITSFDGEPLGKAAMPNPTKIVYYKFIFYTDSNDQLIFDIAAGGGIQKETDLNKFLSDKLNSGSLYSLPIGKTPSPLDFEVYSPCHVVLELESTLNWRFMQGYPAIKMKKTGCKDRYINLFHSTPDNVNGTADSSPPDKRCNIIHFCANNPKLSSGDPPYDDPSNLYVEFFQTTGNPAVYKVMPLVLDPDIKDGGPQLTGDGPPTLVKAKA